MQVRDVLKCKGGRVVTIDPLATIAEAVATLVKHNIGSLPVVDHTGHLVGVISERDVLRHLHQSGDNPGSDKIVGIMTINPATCHPDDDVEDVMGQMSSRHIAKVPVLEEGNLVGIVSVGDVIKVMYERVANENIHLMTYIYGQA
jgi:CBS domain-containing protein